MLEFELRNPADFERRPAHLHDAVVGVPVDGSRHRRPEGGLIMANVIVALCTVGLVWLPLAILFSDRFGLLWAWFSLVKLTGM
jgi:hypothetical protein